MKKNLLVAFSIAALGLLFSTFIFAQEDKVVSAAGDMYIISAKAGGVNYVEGKVSVARKDGKSGYLIKDDNLEIGDKVSTGSDGKAEILLNPGSYVRLGGNSGFEFVTTNLDNLKLKLSSGSAILEVYAGDEFKVSVATPKADTELTRSGVYRVDVFPDGTAKISVWKGKAFVGGNKMEVKAGRAAILNGKAASIAKFDRDNKDDLDVWSQTRAEEAARINKQLQKNSLSNSLINTYNRGGWNMYNSFGLWVFDPFTRRWCFLPFGSGWSSPYGYDYGFDLWRCRLPYYVYNQPQPTPTTPPTPPTTGGNPAPSQANIDRGTRVRTPTFQRFENNQRNESNNDDNQRNGSRNRQRDDNGNSRRDDGGGWNNNQRNDSNDSRSNDSRPVNTTPPIMSTPSPTVDVPSRTETKNVKDN